MRKVCEAVSTAILCIGFLLSAAASAAPPSIGGSMTLPIPPVGASVAVNLRQLGVLSGSAPLTIGNVQMLVNGQTTATLVATVLQIGGPGAVCVNIRNADFSLTSPAANFVSMRLSVSNAAKQSAGPAVVSVTNGQAPGVDRETCGDPNSPPRANPGTNRTVNDTDSLAGEIVVLNGSGSSDPDPGTVLSYLWTLDGVALGARSTSPTLSARLPNGINTVELTVTDDSGDTQTGSDSARVIITVNAPQVQPQPPTISAGSDRTIADTNGVAGETVTLTATATDSDGTIQSIAWRAGNTVLGTGATIQASLPDGTTDIAVTATDNSGLTATDSIRVTVTPPAQAPTVNAGADRAIPDTNGTPGETVTLTATASDPDGTIQSYSWRRGETILGTTATIQATLPDGVSDIIVTVTDNTGNAASDGVQITVRGGARPTANAGANRTIADTDGLPGEDISLTGTGTDSDSTISEYAWLVGDTMLGSGATLQTRLPDGVSTVTLRVTDNAGATGTDTVQITVGAVVMPVANAGNDRILTDTDREPGELFVLRGSGSSRAGTIVSYEWFSNDRLIGSNNPVEVRLPDGVNTITLTIKTSTNLTSSDTLQVTVAAPLVRTPLADLPNLDPTQKSVAESLDRVCGKLDDAIVGGKGLTVEQRALNRRCDALYFNNTAANQTEALGVLVTDNFAVARTQTLLFANTQYASVMDRLIALRGGARGLSLAGLTITVDGSFVPLAELQELGKELLGGGASADSGEPGGLLDEKVGLWARGNYSFGSKDSQSSSPGFDADQWSLIGGADYRISSNAVVGGAIAYGDANVEFSRHDGALRTRSWAFSAYGSMYASRNPRRSIYIDGILNVADAGYDADRNIAYVDGEGLVNENARGSTSGLTLSAGVSGGYDLLWKGLTVSPTLGVYYIDATLDSFTENGAEGLNLLYDKQKFASLTGNLGLRLTYALNLPFGVLLPHMRIDYVREFNNDLDVFSVRFAADPDGTSAPPILVQTDNPDDSYWRLAVGMSAQLRFGLSSYVEYQRLQSFDALSFQDLSFGIRAQKRF